MRPHEKLEVWSRAVDFVTVIYRMTDNFPREEKFGLTSQIRRAAVSVPANIAEGAARESPREFAHFLSNAQGSASELATELLIAHRLRFLGEQDYSDLNSELDNIGRMLFGLSQHVKKKVHKQ
ncbi:MAG: four helix bundle protein [Pyrinomonadaceae bacterium]